MFRQIDSNTYNCRCPICGDSKKSENKTRLYFFIKNNSVRVYCHNCGYSSNLGYFLKQVDPTLYNAYVFENLREKNIDRDIRSQQQQNSTLNALRASKTIATAIHDHDNVLCNAIRVDKLSDDHFCKRYVVDRLIPTDKQSLLYYVDDFKRFVNELIPGKFKNKIAYSVSRFIIPFFDQNGKFFEFHGRALDRDAPIRYYTIKLDEQTAPIYGLDRVDYSKTIYCTEGPIDSLFLPNCIAVSGSHYDEPLIERLKDSIVIVPDNERRNKSVVQSVGKMIDNGFKVCLWPDDVVFKDINDAIIQGYSSQQLVEIINNNTVSGLTGKVKFKLWTKF